MNARERFLQRAAAALLTVFGIVTASLCAAQTAWKPDKVVEFLVGSSPGGGNDKTARTLQKIWQDNKWLENVVVVNKVGGGGAVAYTYVSQRTGDAHHIVVARKALLTNHILGRSPLHYTETTPLAIMANEPTALAVRADSPIKSIKDLVERLRADSQSITTSVGSTRGATSHMLLAQVAKSAGADPRKLKVVTFGGSNDSITNLLGGHIDLMGASVDAMVPQYRAGAVRILGVSTAQRSAALPNVPTFRDQGYDLVMGNWAAVVGPKGLGPAQVAYWEDLLERTANHPDWKGLVEANALEWDFRKSQPARELMAKDYDLERAMLTELGMVTKP
jgi:putative tricarboxylic transport membrane protein